ncbi:cerebellin-2-like isoform X2 [Chanos chanos]|nr:cerebellin-2-like isoform X2 [Chanos chanos]
MEERVFGNILSQRETLSQLHRLIKETIGGRKVAFTVSTTASTDCFGPFTSDVTVPYGNVTLNYGNGYNPALGVFTAPRAGVYSFSFLAYSSAGAEAMRLYHRLALVQDGREVSAVWEDNREDLQDSGTHTLLLPLSRGSQVYIQLLSGRVLCDTAGHNKFSGYLLYPTEG